jgi:cell division control protein 6
VHRERLNERADLSLHKRSLLLYPYNAGQLRNILDHRRDTLEDGCWRSAAAMAAHGHDGARKAVIALHEASRLAGQDGGGRSPKGTSTTRSGRPKATVSRDW